MTFWDYVDARSGPHECWPWLGNHDRDGYGIFGRDRAHRVAYCEGHQRVLTAIAVVRHTCDNPACCNPVHLIPGTQGMNVADRVARDRSAKGSDNGRAKLTPEQALAVYRAEGSYAEIGRAFGIDKFSVRDIKTGRNWAWLTGAKFPPRVQSVPKNETPPNVTY